MGNKHILYGSNRGIHSLACSEHKLKYYKNYFTLTVSQKLFRNAYKVTNLT